MAILALICGTRRAATSELIRACVGRATLLPIRTEVCWPNPEGTLGVTADVNRDVVLAATSRANSPAIRTFPLPAARQSTGYRSNLCSGESNWYTSRAAPRMADSDLLAGKLSGELQQSRRRLRLSPAFNHRQVLRLEVFSSRAPAPDDTVHVHILDTVRPPLGELDVRAHRLRGRAVDHYPRRQSHAVTENQRLTGP